MEQAWSFPDLQGNQSVNRERSVRRYEAPHSLSMWASRRDDRKRETVPPAQGSGTP